MIETAKNFEWAFGELRDAIEGGMYGTLTFSIQNGVVAHAKKETVSKPPVDNKGAKT